MLKMGVQRAFMKEEFKWRKHVCKRNVKGSPKTKHWSNDYPEFWPRREGWRSKQNNVTERNRSQERHSRCSPTMLEMVRYTAGSRTAVNENGRLTEPLQITVIWLSKSVNRWTENFPDENELPPTARVSAEARDENEWDAHDVWEFRR